MMTTIQAGAYWKGYATALMQVVEDSVPTDYDLDVRKQILKDEYAKMLKQHGMDQQCWMNHFFNN